MQGAWFMVVTKTQNCYRYMYSDFLFDVCKRSLELQLHRWLGGQGGAEGYYLHAGMQHLHCGHIKALVYGS